MPKIPRVMVDGKLVLVQSLKMAREFGVEDQWRAHTALPAGLAPIRGGAVESRIARETRQGTATAALIEEIGPGVLLSPVMQEAIRREQQGVGSTGPQDALDRVQTMSFDPISDPGYKEGNYPASGDVGFFVGGRVGRVVFTAIRNRQISGIRLGRLPAVVFENRSAGLRVRKI